MIQRIREHLTSILVLGTIAWIFGSDTFLLATGQPTYSEQITGWIQSSITNLVIFCGIILLICTHWIYGYYKKRK